MVANFIFQLPLFIKPSITGHQNSHYRTPKFSFQMFYPDLEKLVLSNHWKYFVVRFIYAVT